jgi:hypothetical protein
MSLASSELQRTPSEYDSLPEPIKARYTLKQYLWLSAVEKKRILQSECEPDATE